MSGETPQGPKNVPKIMGMCEACQACQRPRSLKSPIESTPIPPAPMASVAIDLFQLPLVGWEGQNYDTLIVCVDRHSGWVVAIPGLKKGLTGSKVAKAMVQNQWRPFGIPSLITSDQGSHFIGSWWQTMCAALVLGKRFRMPTTIGLMVGRRGPVNNFLSA